MLTSSLVGNVIVYLCFLTFSSFSFSVRDLFQNRFLVRCVVTHIFGKWVGANDVPVVKVFALHSSTRLVRYTKKLFRTNSWLTLCFIPSQKGIVKFSSLPIPPRFSPKSTWSRYHYLSDTGPNVFLTLLLIGIWTTTNFQKQVWIETLGTIFIYDTHGFRRF